MPIYEYHCRKCEKDHEIIQKFSDPPMKICPACGGELKKKISLSAFHLKGGGWYKEGYASKAPEKPKKVEKSDQKVEKKAEKRSETPKKPNKEKTQKK